MYRGRLTIPYIVGDSVVGIKYRTLDENPDGFKYISSVGFAAKRIFNPNILKKLHSKIYVCEGEIDAITLAQLGVPAIAIPGAENWNPVAARALRNRRVVVLADGDGKPGKGAAAGRRLADQILTAVDDAGKIVMEGTDVNEYFNTHGAEKLLEYIGWVQ
jgi:DNA primase